MHTGRQRTNVVNKEQDITIAEQVRKGHDRHERCEHFALIDLSLLSTKGINPIENVLRDFSTACVPQAGFRIGDGDAHAVATASTELGVGVDDELTLGRDAQIPA